MADSKFTPGPWKIGDCDGFIIWASGYRSVKWIECEPGVEAVHIGDAACPGWALRPEIEAKMALDDVMAREEWIEECKANARLMAAAPDYDAFAAAALPQLEVLHSTLPAGQARVAVWRVILDGRAAVAKARAES